MENETGMHSCSAFKPKLAGWRRRQEEASPCPQEYRHQTGRAKKLDKLLTGNSPLGVAMLDLDHFKRFNDTFGHSAGDFSVTRELGRLELIKELKIRRGDQLLSTIAVSAGVAAAPEHGLTAAELPRAADNALYAARQAGRDRVVVYQATPS